MRKESAFSLGAGKSGKPIHDPANADHLSVFMDERDARHEPLNWRMETAPDPLVYTMDCRPFSITVLNLLRCDNVYDELPSFRF
jgi:hypothetical protein